MAENINERIEKMPPEGYGPKDIEAEPKTEAETARAAGMKRPRKQKYPPKLIEEWDELHARYGKQQYPPGLLGEWDRLHAKYGGKG